MKDPFSPPSLWMLCHLLLSFPTACTLVKEEGRLGRVERRLLPTKGTRRAGLDPLNPSALNANLRKPLESGRRMARMWVSQ